MNELFVRTVFLSVLLLLDTAPLAAAPTEQEYIKILLDTLKSEEVPAEEAMRPVIERSDKRDASDQLSLGSALMLVRHHFAAIEVLMRATELAPQNALAFANLGTSYYLTGNCDKAVPSLMKAVQLDPAGPKSGDSSKRIGACLIYMRKDYSQAEKYCAKGRELLPTDPAPRLCLGHAQFGQARYAEALSTYVDTHRLPSSIIYPPYRGEAQSGVLASLAKLNRLSEATEILKLEPGHMYTTGNLERLAANAIERLQRSEKPRW